jgi:N-acetylglucosamine-6-phosphate deacetylase
VLIAASRMLMGADVVSPGYVGWADGVIATAGIGPPPGRPDLELTEGVLLPGLVDLQVNGYFGVELGSAGAAGWAQVARRLAETGVTAFVPTFITSPVAELIAALRRSAAIAADLAGAGPGARVLGIHLEGPFISRNRPGAHNKAWMRDPDPATVKALLDAGAGRVRLVTLAPELDGAMAAIGQLTRAGVLVSVGHSDATAQQVSAAVASGAAMVTHLFNAQRPMHHREPGVVGQALTDTRLVASLIADTHHVAGQVAALAFRAAPGRICLVTDAAASAGMPPGRYVLGGEPVVLRAGDGVPPTRADGTIAGSALRMDAAIANMVGAGVDLAAAAAAATQIPADLIGRRDLGRIAVGVAADLAWLGDDLRTRATWIAGHQAYGLRRTERT